MGDVLNGDLGYIKANSTTILFVTASGTDILTGDLVIGGGLPSVKSQTVTVLPVAGNGNAWEA